MTVSSLLIGISTQTTTPRMSLSKYNKSSWTLPRSWLKKRGMSSLRKVFITTRPSHTLAVKTTSSPKLPPRSIYPWRHPDLLSIWTHQVLISTLNKLSLLRVRLSSQLTKKSMAIKKISNLMMETFPRIISSIWCSSTTPAAVWVSWQWMTVTKEVPASITLVRER